MVHRHREAFNFTSSILVCFSQHCISSYSFFDLPGRKVVDVRWCGRNGVYVGRRTYFDKCVSHHPSGAGSSPAGSVSRDLNLQKLNYQYLTTSVAVVLTDWFCSVFNVVCVVNVCPRCRSELIDSAWLSSSLDKKNA